MDLRDVINTLFYDDQNVQILYRFTKRKMVIPVKRTEEIQSFFFFQL